MGRIPLWVDLRPIPVNKRLPYLHAIEEMAAERVLLEKDDPHTERKGLKSVTIDGKGVLREGPKVVGHLVRISSAKSQDRAAEAEGIVVVDTQDWQVIPMENLIAARGEKPGTLYALARTPEQAALFADTLEIGVHGIVLVPQSTGDVFAADRMLRERYHPVPPKKAPTVTEAAAPEAGKDKDKDKEPGKEAKEKDGRDAKDKDAKERDPKEKEDKDGKEAAGKAKARQLRVAKRKEGAEPAQAAEPAAFLVPARVTAVEDGGVGDRVCIDTTSLFRDGEGLLVGSTARSFALIHAETVESEYVAPRPFRVNAGAVHSYLYAPEGKTRYLSELGAGMPVLAVHPDGIHRVLTIGRCKIERRPHTLIRWKSEDHRVGMAMLQTAETIRLVRPDGTLVAVTDLKVDDDILVHNESSARHFGMAVDSQLEER